MFNFFNELILDYGLENSQINDFNIINISNKLIYIEGQKGVFSISDTKICIKVKKYKINIIGDSLVIKRITENTLVIVGKITRIESVVWNNTNLK